MSDAKLSKIFNSKNTEFLSKIYNKYFKIFSKRSTNSGSPPQNPYNPVAPSPINPDTGMHEDYWVLSEEERDEGFIRPVRLSYIHESCRSETTMSRPIAETYARDPKFYGATMCVRCKAHFPVNEFRWSGMDEIVGS